MKDAIYRISLDIHEHGSQAVLKVKKTDTGRKVHITLRGGGTPYTIEDDCYAVFKATKPDGSILYNACTIENNEIIYEFTEQTCTAVGRCRCEIALYGMDDKLITSPRFALLVDGTIYPDELVESTDEFSALTKLISDTMEATEAATQAAQSADRATQRSNEAASAAETATTRADESADHADQVAEEVKNCAVLTSPQNLDEAKQKQARKNIGADALIVTVVTINSNMTTSHTSTEIYEHVRKGGVAYLYYGGKYIPITASERYAFAYEISDEGYVDYYEIEGNSLIVVEHHFAKESWVEKQIEHSFDSIETGLDAIIDVQNEMLGIVSFICVGEIYTAIPDMTWGEWCDSEYNTVGAEVYSGVVLFSGASICDENGTVQTGDMVIVAGSIYELN